MKVRRNKERDARVTADCKAAGWRIVRVWEHTVTNDPERVARTIKKSLTGGREGVALGLIRFGGHRMKGRYGVPHGRREEGAASA